MFIIYASISGLPIPASILTLSWPLLALAGLVSLACSAASSPSLVVLAMNILESPHGGELIYRWNLTSSASLYFEPVAVSKVSCNVRWCHMPLTTANIGFTKQTMSTTNICRCQCQSILNDWHGHVTASVYINGRIGWNSNSPLPVGMNILGWDDSIKCSWW